MNDIKYTRNGIEKMAQERFKDALIAVGWEVVAEVEVEVEAEVEVEVEVAKDAPKVTKRKKGK